MSDLVLDNTVLSHFARAGQLASLQALVAAYRCVTPAEVSRELVAGIAEHPALARTVALPWVDVVDLVEIEEVIAFARYKARVWRRTGPEQRGVGRACMGFRP